MNSLSFPFLSKHHEVGQDIHVPKCKGKPRFSSDITSQLLYSHLFYNLTTKTFASVFFCIVSVVSVVFWPKKKNALRPQTPCFYQNIFLMLKCIHFPSYTSLFILAGSSYQAICAYLLFIHHTQFKRLFFCQSHKVQFSF